METGEQKARVCGRSGLKVMVEALFFGVGEKLGRLFFPELDQ